MNPIEKYNTTYPRSHLVHESVQGSMSPRFVNVN